MLLSVILELTYSGVFLSDMGWRSSPIYFLSYAMACNKALFYSQRKHVNLSPHAMYQPPASLSVNAY